MYVFTCRSCSASRVDLTAGLRVLLCFRQAIGALGDGEPLIICDVWVKPYASPSVVNNRRRKISAPLRCSWHYRERTLCCEQGSGRAGDEEWCEAMMAQLAQEEVQFQVREAASGLRTQS